MVVSFEGARCVAMTSPQLRHTQAGAARELRRQAAIAKAAYSCSQ